MKLKVNRRQKQSFYPLRALLKSSRNIRLLNLNSFKSKKILGSPCEVHRINTIRWNANEKYPSEKSFFILSKTQKNGPNYE